MRKPLSDGSGEMNAVRRFMQLSTAQQDVRNPPRAKQPDRFLGSDSFDHTIVTAPEVGSNFNARRRMRFDKKNGARLAATGKPNDIIHTTVTACGAGLTQVTLHFPTKLRRPDGEGLSPPGDPGAG